MGQKFRTSGTLLLAGLVMSACQDLPTTVSEVAPPKDAVTSRYSIPGRVSKSAITCYVSRRVTGREYKYAYGTLRLHFPANTFAADGSTRLFRWRVQELGQEPVVSGSCQIPATPEAYDFVMKRLGLIGQGKGDDDGVVSVQNCVQLGTCLVAGFVVVAPSSSTWGWSGSWNGGGGSGPSNCNGTWDGSYCDEWEEDRGGDVPDPGPDGTYRPKCDREASGHCITRELGYVEFNTVALKIHDLLEPTPACARAKAILLDLVAQGPAAMRIRGWTGYDVFYDPSKGEYRQKFGQVLSDAQGRYIQYDIDWVTTDRQDPDDREVIVHEGLHMYLNEINSPLMGQAAEDWMTSEQKKCVGNP